MLTAINADMCSKCFVTDPWGKSFISLALVVAAADVCGNSGEIRIQESILKRSQNRHRSDYAGEPACLGCAPRRAHVSLRLFSGGDRCFLCLVFHADDEMLADSAHAVGVDVDRLGIVGD